MGTSEDTYNNLIDECIALDEDPSLKGDVKAEFSRLLSNYFFRREIELSKNLELFLSNFSVPDIFNGFNSIIDIDIDILTEMVHGNSINDSLAGKIMLSQQYLKSFYPNHSPSYSKLPEDIRFELMQLIKEKNECIITAFSKMKADVASDRNRQIMTLIALILKNIHLRSGMPLNTLQSPLNVIIQKIFPMALDRFDAKPKQISELLDDSKIKELIKIIFKVKQFKEITILADQYKQEFSRYHKRALKVAQI